MLQSMPLLKTLTDNADFLGIPTYIWVLLVLVVIVQGIYFYRRGRLE